MKEGRFVPVGGMWVESDTNMVGGEALVRQFVQGKRFFIEQLGVEPTDVWLPDSFGYTGAFPQVARLAGCENFLTQKMSWNDTNKFPHHTFWWEGIDGSRVFMHFPPVDTYNSDLSAAELALASGQFAEKGRADTSLAPFGYGDGGGGPTREMVSAAHRAADLEGSPRVVLSDPNSFFEAARAEYADPPTWMGELYLEYHRGTYTTQSRTKQGNRRSEHLLREAESGPRLPPCARASSTPTTIWSAPGARCCSSSSTTSCRARRSLGCTARPSSATPRWRRCWRGSSRMRSKRWRARARPSEP